MKHSVIKHFGHGAGAVPMPSAISRAPRKVWPVSPSFIIMLLAVTFFVFFKTTLDNKKLFKPSETIIILPDKPKIPEPTVKEKVPLIKVLKDAVKKSVEKKKVILKKIEPKKIEPKKLKPAPIKPKQLKPKKIKLLKKPNERKLIKKFLKPKPKVLNKKPELLEKKIVRKLKKNNLVKPGKIKPKKLTNKKLVVKNQLKEQIQKKVLPEKLPETKRIISSKKITVKKAEKRFILNESKPVSKFTPLTTGLTAKPSAVKSFSKKKRIIRSTAKIPVAVGPAPKLTQREPPSARPVTNVSGRTAKFSSPKLAAKKPVVPVQDIIPVVKVTKSIDVMEYVIIESNVLDYSERVKNLKIAIYEKAKSMDPDKSPYVYQVRGYKCKVIIKKNGVIRITFKPGNAPFEVVSALERKLPNK